MEEGEKTGSIHPITTFIDQAHTIFREIGFSVADGPQLESEFNNFDALNVPADHPARDIQDTFWVKNPKDGKDLLRTQTSGVQIRYMMNNKPPFRIISPGLVYRQEATDATHEAQFHQIEGLVVEEGANLANLRGTLEYFLKKIFNDDNLITRFRPGYFPFVEPGVEIDISCSFCKSDSCRVCKGTGWIEILGAGMVHPNVFRAVGVDSEKWKGFAFGLSPERILMLKHGIHDIRLFHSGDMRFISQF